jgi:hypothetical protein
VKAGKLSAHRAAIEAGFRSAPSPLRQMQATWERASEAERQAMREWIGGR